MAKLYLILIVQYCLEWALERSSVCFAFSTLIVIILLMPEIEKLNKVCSIDYQYLLILCRQLCALGNVFCNIPCTNHQKQWIPHPHSRRPVAAMACFFKVYLVAHRGILEPVHYMHYIFFLQAHLNRIYQVWNPRRTEMYRSSDAKYASRFD